MGRIISIDFGRKRTGIAATDIFKIVANGIATVPTAKVIDFLKEYVAREPVELIVVGLPKQLNEKMDRRDKAVVDTIAATIILNDYLQSRQYNDK